MVWLLIGGVIGCIASVLMAAGILGLAYGGFTYTKEDQEASIGSVSLSIDDKRRVNNLRWAGGRRIDFCERLEAELVAIDSNVAGFRQHMNFQSCEI